MQHVVVQLVQTDYFKVFILFSFLEMGFIFYCNISKGWSYRLGVSPNVSKMEHMETWGFSLFRNKILTGTAGISHRTEKPGFHQP